MAEVIPFQGWRYNTQKISDIHSVFSPLSDVLNPTLMRSMYANPLSSLHLSVPISHISAFSKIQQWKADEFLIQDPDPRFYVLYQTFRLPNETAIYTRKGILCGIKLKDKADDDIVIHENTIVEAVKDRTLYLQKIHMNIVPTHGLFEDKEHEIEALLDSSSKEFLYEYTDIQNVRNTLYTLDEADMIEKIQAILADKKIYLADGHHRLASSQAYRESLKRQGVWEESASANFHLMYLTNLISDDLRILPTHRIWQPAFDAGIDKYLQQIGHYFDITNISGNPTPLYDYIKDRPYAFGLFHRDYEYLLELKKDIQPQMHISLGLAKAVKALSYTVLHYFFFQKVGCIPYHKQNLSPEIIYEKSYSQAIKAAAKGSYSFICREVHMEEMLAVCNADAIMPPKSTFFFPKVVCGMVFMESK